MQPHYKRAMRSVYSRDGLLNEETAANYAASNGAGVQPVNDRETAAATTKKISATRANPLGASVQLPTVGRVLLLSAYLAARLPARADVALFSNAPRKPGRKGSGPKNTKLADVPHAFTLDRLLAIYTSIAPPEPQALAAAAATHASNVAAAAAAAAASSASGAAAAAAGPTSATAYSVAQTNANKPSLRSELLVQLASLLDLAYLSRASDSSNIDMPRLRCEAPREVVAARAAAQLRSSSTRRIEARRGLRVCVSRGHHAPHDPTPCASRRMTKKRGFRYTLWPSITGTSSFAGRPIGDGSADASSGGAAQAHEARSNCRCSSQHQKQRGPLCWRQHQRHKEEDHEHETRPPSAAPMRQYHHRSTSVLDNPKLPPPAVSNGVLSSFTRPAKPEPPPLRGGDPAPRQDLLHLLPKDTESPP